MPVMKSGMETMTVAGCKISMLWNWNTVGSCFLDKSWKISSEGAFAALCIGVILLVILLEFLRRLSKWYDKHLVHKHELQAVAMATHNANQNNSAGDNHSADGGDGLSDRHHENPNGSLIAKSGHFAAPTAPFRPNIYHQAIRALLHTLQFAVAYWIMLLAIYYNGYIIICILIGAFIGAFIFQWERLGGQNEYAMGLAHSETTACCG